LLGVRTAGTNWWKPDGSPLAQSPYFRASNTPTPPPGSRVYELAATWSAPGSATAGNDPVSWSVSSGNAFGGAALASDGKRMKDVHMLSVILPEDTKTLNVAFHVAAGPWTTAAEWDGKGKQLDTQGSNVKLRILLEGNRTRVISADGITDRAARLTVFLNGGKTATASMGQSPQWPRVIETRVDVPAAISRIKFETSSFQHLICTNASLDPLERTTVKWKSGGAWLPGERSFESVDAGGDALTTASLLADFPVDNAIIPGISVGLIRIGMTDAELEAAVGKPEWIPGKSSATVRHFPSRGFSVTLSGGSGGDTTPRRVTSVVCGGDTATPAARKLVDAFTLKTPDGIGMGSTQSDIERALGKPDDIGRPDPNDDWRSIKYLDKGIEFALRDGKVVWLAVRAPRK
jgi:hypothetical protein